MTDQPSSQTDEIINRAAKAVREEPFPLSPPPSLVEYTINLRRPRPPSVIAPRTSWLSVAATLLILASGWVAARWYCLRDDPARFPVAEQRLAGGVRRIIYSDSRVEMMRW